MKTDLYTKTILTLIAACLLVIVLRPLALVPSAAAAAAGGRTYGLVPVNADGSLTVRLQARAPMKVNIVSISSPYDHLNSELLNWDVIKTSK